jgi:hypothetical protein
MGLRSGSRVGEVLVTLEILFFPSPAFVSWLNQPPFVHIVSRLSSFPRSTLHTPSQHDSLYRRKGFHGLGW